MLRTHHYTAGLEDLFLQLCIAGGTGAALTGTPSLTSGQTGTQNLVLAFWEQCWFYFDNFIMCIYSKLHIKSPNHLTPFITEGIIY